MSKGKELGLWVLLVFEILLVVSQITIYAIIAFHTNNYVTILIPFLFNSIIVFGASHYLTNRYIEKHKKYQIVYLVDKSKNDKL